MYAWLWRQLPGPFPVRLLLATVLAAGVVAACFLWVFPAVAEILPVEASTLGGP